jgi:hypothetical protein
MVNCEGECSAIVEGGIDTWRLKKELYNFPSCLEISVKPLKCNDPYMGRRVLC